MKVVRRICRSSLGDYSAAGDSATAWSPPGQDSPGADEQMVDRACRRGHLAADGNQELKDRLDLRREQDVGMPAQELLQPDFILRMLLLADGHRRLA